MENKTVQGNDRQANKNNRGEKINVRRGRREEIKKKVDTSWTKGKKV